jgi:hypothetical protein
MYNVSFQAQRAIANMVVFRTAEDRVYRMNTQSGWPTQERMVSDDQEHQSQVTEHHQLSVTMTGTALDIGNADTTKLPIQDDNDEQGGANSDNNDDDVRGVDTQPTSGSPSPRPTPPHADMV